MKKIDKDYFLNYGGSGNYSKIFMDHTRADHCVSLFKHTDAYFLKKICILGTATGKVNEFFYKNFNIVPYGCELNEWAYKQIPSKFKKRVSLMNMLEYCKLKRSYDLVFTDSLQYLNNEEIDHLLGQLRTKFLCYYGHFQDINHIKDPCRVTTKTYAWWNKKFKKHGFKEMPSTWGKSYLWKRVGKK